MKVPGKPRPYWNLVRINKILQSSYNETRVVEIIKSDGKPTVTSVENSPIRTYGRF